MRRQFDRRTVRAAAVASAAGIAALLCSQVPAAGAQELGSLGTGSHGLGSPGSGSLGSLGSSAVGAAASAGELSPYVALGDSYSSGAGIEPLVPGAPEQCSRSTLSYPHLVAAAVSPGGYTDVSCSGAATADMTGFQGPGILPQYSALRADARLVTVTIGGNDGNVFGGIIGGCAEAAKSAGDYSGAPCRARFGVTFAERLHTTTGPAVTAVLREVHRRAPQARVVVPGYLRILPAAGSAACVPSMPFAVGDVPYLDSVEEALNAELKAAAEATGSTFVDVAGLSAGHDACAGAERWVEPAVNPHGAAAVHPNAAGHRAVAGAVLAALGR